MSVETRVTLCSFHHSARPKDEQARADRTWLEYTESRLAEIDALLGKTSAAAHQEAREKVTALRKILAADVSGER